MSIHRILLLAAVFGSVFPPQSLAAQSLARVSTASAQVGGSVRVSNLERRITIDLDGVPLMDALQSIARQAAIGMSATTPVLKVEKRVTVKGRQIRAVDAFRTALEGTPVRMTAVSGNEVLFEVSTSRAVRVQGTITGKVIDAANKRPVEGATVQVEGLNRTTQTTQDGSFRVPEIPAGTYTVFIRRIGYGKMSRQVTVGQDATTTIDVALEVSASALEQVVVTGTIVQTELKAVPSAITVVTAKQIEERGITRIDQLFRGDIPGVFALNRGSSALLDEVTMFSRGATALSEASLGTAYFTNHIKTYVDGVELSNPEYMSQIDPRSIERIEILTGPQATTIYGSNAMNGVMQIFTKRGTASRPQFTLNLLSGWVENNFSAARTSQHDYSVQMDGIEGRLSYNAGGSWNYMGAWTPSKQTARMSGFGGTRLDIPTRLGRLTTDLTLRRAITQNLKRGSELEGWTFYRETGWYTNLSNNGVSAPTTYVMTGQTLGLTLGYAPIEWWSHELGIGHDVLDTETRRTARGYASLSDTSLFFRQDHTHRRSLRYATTLRFPVTTYANATVTAGGDGWQHVRSYVSTQTQHLTGPVSGAASVQRDPGHNAGGFLQTQLSLGERLFLTYGLRAEWNPGYGSEAQPNVAPRYGAAYTHELGTMTAKLRGSYGRATRPPHPDYKLAQSIADYYETVFGDRSLSIPIIADYGNYDQYLANPELTPEYQQGGEGGVELYFGTRGSLVVTRYRQTVNSLIANPKIDSVRSRIPNPPSGGSSPDADGYRYRNYFQYVNIGNIRNEGWELQGSTNVGPLTARGTYSWTKSRSLGVSPRYQGAFNALGYPQYQPGATFRRLPEHTWALGLTYASATTMVGLNVTGMGRFTKDGSDDFSDQRLASNIRLQQNRWNTTFPNYVTFNKGYALADLTASRRFSSAVESVLQIQNLMDRYEQDYASNYAALGRTMKAGVRIRLK